MGVFKIKRILIVGLILVFALSIISGCGGSAPSQPAAKDQQIKLKVADLFPTSHPVSAEGISVWMKRVTELTGGKVQFEYYPAEQLGKSKDLLKVAQTKVADIAFVGPSYVTANMPLSSVMELPGAVKSSVAGEQVFWKLTQTTLLKPEFQKNQVMPVMVYVLPPYEVWTLSKPVTNPGDIKGLKLRSVGGVNDQTIKTVGGIPVAQPITEMYESLQKKVTDGTILSPISIKPYKVQELLKHATVGANVGTFVGVYCINESVWQSLPADVQKAMVQAGEEASKHLAEVLDKQATDFMKEFEQAGLKINKLDASTQKAWADALTPVEAEWIKKMEETGNGELAKQLVKERKELSN